MTRTTNTGRSTPTAAAKGSERRADEVVIEAVAAHRGRTAAELAHLTGLGGSTVTKVLAALEKAGRARRDVRAPADGTGRRVAARWYLTSKTGNASDASPPAARRPTEAKSRATTAKTTPPTVSAQAKGRTATTSARGTGDGAPRNRRLGKGELNTMVLEYLRARPKEEFGPTAIGKALQRSQGAVANCLTKLTSEGDLTQTSDKPRRYRIAN